jgi:leader peptidase (prepilin peptidase)/N-methyltransferase
MNLFWAAAGAVAGLPAGTCLRGLVYRMSVRSGEPDEANCRTCALPLSGRPTDPRCPHCRTWYGAPLVIELVCAAVLAVLLARFGGQPAVAAFGFLAVIGVALAQVDAAVQRLPDRLTLPAYPALVLLLGIAALLDRDPAALVRALLAGLALAAGYLLLSLVSGGQLGGGDVKLAGLLGLALGWAGWSEVVTGASLGFILAAITSVALLAARRISRRAVISFGPYMLSGAFLAILAPRP